MSTNERISLLEQQQIELSELHNDLVREACRIAYIGERIPADLLDRINTIDGRVGVIVTLLMAEENRS